MSANFQKSKTTEFSKPPNATIMFVCYEKARLDTEHSFTDFSRAFLKLYDDLFIRDITLDRSNTGRLGKIS